VFARYTPQFIFCPAKHHPSLILVHHSIIPDLAPGELHPRALPWCGFSSPRYAGYVFFIKFKAPESAGERYWNRVQSWLDSLFLVSPFVLKLTGVINWSWWWVALSPLGLSVAVLVLLSPWWLSLARKGAERERAQIGSPVT